MKKFMVTVNGNTYEVDVEEVKEGQLVNTEKPQIVKPVIKRESNKMAVEHTASEGAQKIVAPMPGKIIDIKVTIGQEVKEGDLVAILEAMKMENEIFATTSGKVATINVSSGTMIEAQDTIITVG